MFIKAGFKINILAIESIAVVSELVHAHITQPEGDLPELRLETVSDYNKGAFAGDFIEPFLCLQRASRTWSILFFSAHGLIRSLGNPG